jgi:hypothetical protein
MKKTLTFLFLFMSMVIHAQNDALPDYPGTVHVKKEYSVPKGVPVNFNSQEERSMQAKLDKIIDLIRTNPVVSNPRGIEVFLQTGFEPVVPEIDPWNNVKCHADLLYKYWYEENGVKGCSGSTTARGFSMKINQPGYMFNGLNLGIGDLFIKPGYPINQEPKQIYEQNGFMIYEQGIVVIAKKDKPLWIPVTVSEFYEVLFSKIDREIQQGENVVMLQKQKEMMQEQYRRYSASDLKESAWFNGFYAEPEGKKQEGMIRLVTYNPAYFDERKPKSAIQLIILHSSFIGPGLSDQTGPYNTSEDSALNEIRLAETMKLFDYNRFAAFLE